MVASTDGVEGSNELRRARTRHRGLVHSMFGLRPVELSAARRLRESGHRVVTPDLFAGAIAGEHGTTPVTRPPPCPKTSPPAHRYRRTPQPTTRSPDPANWPHSRPARHTPEPTPPPTPIPAPATSTPTPACRTTTPPPPATPYIPLTPHPDPALRHPSLCETTAHAGGRAVPAGRGGPRRRRAGPW